MKKQFLIIAMCAGISTGAIASESPEKGMYDSDQIEYLQTGRYTKVKNIPPVDQLNPLKVVIRTTIPQDVTTVRDSVNFLLVRSGYELADDSVLSKEAKTLLSHELPQIHRNFGSMTLDQALHTLAGESFELVVDPVNRKIAFELTEKIARLY